MSENCKHCDNVIEFNFCGNCGQRRAKRIDRTYIKDELQYTVLHMNKGFLYSIKRILKNPGTTAREFIEGNRVNHYKPILLVFVLAGITAFLTSTFVDAGTILSEYYTKHNVKQPFNVEAFYGLTMKYYSLYMLLAVPFMAFFTWMAFKKWGYNYYEHIIINGYFLSYYLIVNIVILIPVQIALKNHIELFMFVPSLLALMFGFAQLLYFFIQFFNNRDAGQVVLRLFLMAVIGGIAFIVFFVILGIIVGIYMSVTKTNPNDLFNIAPVVKDSINGLIKI